MPVDMQNNALYPIGGKMKKKVLFCNNADLDVNYMIPVKILYVGFI